MSFVITEPAPIIQFSPILMLGKMDAPVPIKDFLPMVTLPEIFTPGQISTNSLIRES